MSLELQGGFVRFWVPGTPQGKGRARVSVRGGHARAYTPARTRVYESAIADAARAAGLDLAPAGVPLAVTIDCYFAIPRSWTRRRAQDALSHGGWVMSRPDADNVSKSVLDALLGIVYADDAQVSLLVASKRYCEDANPGVHVHVARLD